ncbi:hypothetical protein D3872_23515 [Massilia cavernae]|uniref:Uncharacterized protein n=1 Tax=Massilia cavernae TaxID=2320864 RepID=A0A418X7Z6_9BURK|nr:hypothetical protein D3872_23515 [Massilia cavernae]
MNQRRQVARIIVPGIAAGGAIGGGVGLDLYPPAVGIVGSVVIGVVVAAAAWRARRVKAR